MDTQQPLTSSSDSTSDDTLLCSGKEHYHAPQLKKHGQLQRLTLQGGISPGGGNTGGGGATPTPDPDNP